MVHVVERLGAFRHRQGFGLGDYAPHLARFAERSPLAEAIPREHRDCHVPFTVLYELVRTGRNDAAHQGAYARHLTTHAVELALILEDSLMTELECAADFMVPEPTCADLWQPVSFARQKMLLNSFSFLPVWEGDSEPRWRLLSDRGLVRFLRAPSKGSRSRERRRRLGMSLKNAVRKDLLELEEAVCCHFETPVVDVARKLTDQPCLVVDLDNPARLLGIITAFDVL